jgi:tetratricopeptide (TPR) repeat protein
MTCFRSRVRKGHRRLGIALALLLLSVGAVARAADITPQQKQEMKSLYERATRAYDVGKYNEAIEEYQKAYEIGGDPPMLYNIAQAYRLNDQPGEAVRFYRRYLQRAPNARNKDDVERKIAEQEKIVEDRRKAQAAVTPPPAPPPVTTAPPSTTPPAPAVTVGPPAPAPAVTTTPEPVTGETPPPAPVGESSSGKTLKIVGIAVIGVGVLAEVGSLIFGKIAKDKGDSLTSMSDATTKVQFDPSIQQAGKNAQTAQIALGITAGVAAVAGVILVIVGSTSGDSAPAEAPPATTARATIAPWLAPGLVGAGAGFRF